LPRIYIHLEIKPVLKRLWKQISKHFHHWQFGAKVKVSLEYTLLIQVFSRQIFTEDLPEVEGLPRDKVLAHIEQSAKQLTIRYLVSSSSNS